MLVLMVSCPNHLLRFICRLLPARSRGDANKCDYLGNTALHWAVINGHLNCVSFLVNFEVNLWTLNNDFHTAKDIAAIKNSNKEILDLLDAVVAKQSALNPKAVQKAKEKALLDAEKRVKSFEKLHKKASKKAEREEKQLEKSRLKKNLFICGTAVNINSSLLGSLRRDSLLYEPKNHASLKFSDIVNNGTISTTTNSKHRGFGAVSRKVQLRKVNATDSLSMTGSLADFKIRDIASDRSTGNSVRSLTALRRDNEILYVRKNVANNGSLCDPAPIADKLATAFTRHPHLKDLFSSLDDSASTCTMKIRRAHLNGHSNLVRTTSEPDFIAHMRSDSGLGDDAPGVPPEASIFERPGFGSVAFRHSMAQAALKTEPKESDSQSVRSSGQRPAAAGNATTGSAGSDSIGSAGSLAQRNATISLVSGRSTPWDDDPLIEDLADEDVKALCDAEGADKLQQVGAPRCQQIINLLRTS